MTVYVGSARIDEHGQAHGGMAGDQTGMEVSTQREEWADIKGFCGLYRVSTLGRVYSVPRKGFRGRAIGGNYLSSDKPTKNGYACVNLRSTNFTRLSVPIHRLVAEEFIPNPNGLPQVNHKDGNKLNNCVSNLEWVSSSDNVRHAVKNGLMRNHFHANYGEYNYNHKLSDSQVERIRDMYRNGIKSPALSRLFGVSKGHVCKIVKDCIRKNGSVVYDCVCR